ncbi:hypothetical protein CS063_07925 [Sporanaerobium hydrogeniformans]|uniref:Uncharacterized protein n=1 Tax=Sporanaerobium hydrogeniformans TaxID=3072179 RepID=A0AC61DCA8_9FIRM|nr:hypothetical protein [Sporanaerobium hydrogeniformans]PHV70939.1 hypothetical protein CS063_07925 [Sporanaerobium hydrogeniformans]
MKNKLFALLGALLIVGVFAYVQLPVLKPDFTSLYMTVILFLGLFGCFCMDRSALWMLSKTSKVCFGLAGILFVYVLVIPPITSIPFLHANSYRNLIGEVTESNFSEDVSPVSVEDIRLVDEQTAIRLGDKKLGEIPALGSISKLGEFHIQKIKDDLYWVAPLVHRDIIKWVTNLSGTTGYIMVSATNPQDVQFVQELDGKPVKIVYQPDAYLHQDLARHMYTHGFANVGLTDFTLEINDEGRPYWVVTLYEHKVGYSGSDAIGVATVDAQTGEVASYTPENAPEWVDRIQPESFIGKQINDWGLYINGFLNSQIAEEGVLLATPGMSLVYGEDGSSYWYTGITSSGADESTIGFMLVNTRTKEAKLYKQPGATETATMRSAEGKVQEKGYNATFPVMYNILGTPTYVMSLKDNAGLIKMISFVSVEDYSLVGIGETKQAALRSYKEALKAKGNDISIAGQGSSTQTVEGLITRINQDVQSGNTYYYFMVDKLPHIIFNGSSSLSNELPVSQVGDPIKISYDSYDDITIDLISFDNLNIIAD